MDAVALALRQLDDLWEHSWESFKSVLSDLGDDEARWRDACYGDVAAGSGLPPGSVLWHLMHLAGCKQDYADRLSGQPGLATTATAETTLSAALEQLRRAHEAERAAVTRVEEADLDRVLPDGLSVAELISLALRHDAWHLGQIAVARRMWRLRGPATSTR